MNLSSIINESKAVQSDSFVKNIENVIDLLHKESGRIGNLDVSEGLVKLEPSGEALVIGDLHGDLKSLTNILRESDLTRKMTASKDAILIFLGDYGDRGEYSAEVYYTIVKIKLAFPEQVILLRGNHEGPPDLMASPHDLPMQFQLKFKEKWKVVYSKIRELFDCLYNAVLVKDQCLMVHGGLSPNINSIRDLARAHVMHPTQELLEDLLWSDPNDMVQEILYSPRGAGKLFGKCVTERVLKKLSVKILIRGHEPCQEGFKINHDGKVLTLFSRKGPPYFNKYGAYLRLPLSENFDSNTQLIPWIHKF